MIDLVTRHRRLAVAAMLAGILAAATLAAAVPQLTGTAPALDRLDAAASQRPVNAAEAIDDAEAGVDAAPDSPDALATLGQALLEQVRTTGDPSALARAGSVLTDALERDPEHIGALIGLGSLALTRHDFAGALAIGERARRLAPDVARIYGIIGDAQVELGRYDEALVTVQAMVDMRPDLASYSRVAYLRELYGDSDGAAEAMELALSAGGPTPENTEYVRVQLGNLRLVTGRVDEAEAHYRASLERIPGFVHAQAGMARVEIAGGDLDAAIDRLLEATLRLPLPDLVVLLGETLEAAGRDEEAAEQYALADAMQRLYEANGVGIDLELAAFGADHGDPAAAVELAERAYAERPSVHGADVLAWALHRAGRTNEADRYAAEAMRLGGRDPRILYHAGAIAASLGDTERARALLEAAVDPLPGFHPIDGPRAADLLRDLPEG